MFLILYYIFQERDAQEETLLQELQEMKPRDIEEP
jgi:hypothetical protein